MGAGLECVVTYEKKLADVRARLSRLIPEGSQTDPVAVARRLFRLGMDYSPEAVAVVISYLENTSIEADPAIAACVMVPACVMPTAVTVSVPVPTAEVPRMIRPLSWR